MTIFSPPSHKAIVQAMSHGYMFPCHGFDLSHSEFGYGFGVWRWGHGRHFSGDDCVLDLRIPDGSGGSFEYGESSRGGIPDIFRDCRSADIQKALTWGDK